MDEGSVCVDGVDVRDYSLRQSPDGVGMVLQKNVLFSGTIAENSDGAMKMPIWIRSGQRQPPAQAANFVSFFFRSGYETNLGMGWCEYIRRTVAQRL